MASADGWVRIKLSPSTCYNVQHLLQTFTGEQETETWVSGYQVWKKGGWQLAKWLAGASTFFCGLVSKISDLPTRSWKHAKEHKVLEIFFFILEHFYKLLKQPLVLVKIHKDKNMLWPQELIKSERNFNHDPWSLNHVPRSFYEVSIFFTCWSGMFPWCSIKLLLCSRKFPWCYLQYP